MANIANVRRFDGIDDWLKFTPTDLIAPFGAITMLAILKINTDPADGAFQDILTLTGGTGGQMGFLLENPGGAATTGLVGYFDPGAAVFGNPSFVNSTMGWVLVGLTKPAGDNQTGRAHLYRYDTLVWDHVSIGASDIDAGTTPTGSPSLRIGTWNESIEFLAADVAAVAFWNNDNLSDGEIEAMHGNIAAWDAQNPTGLWLLNQTAVTETVLDRTGAGDEIARSGTSVVTPTGLTFDDGSVAGLRFDYSQFPKAVLRPTVRVRY